MDILDLLAQDNYLIVNRTIAKELGIENAIVFGALCSYQRSFKNDEFYREQEKIITDTCLSEYLVRKAIRDLKDKGLIIVEKKGLPAKYFYKIKIDNLLKILSTSGAKIDTTSSSEFDTTTDTNINTTNNNKSNNINNNKDDKESKERELFDEFWKVYPRKVDKQGSFKAYRNIPHLEQEHPIIIKAIETLKHSMQWQDIRFIPHPTTFIHQRRWENVNENESPFPKSYDEPQEHATDEEIEKWYWDNYQEKVVVKNGRVIEWNN